jgi:hypothetical protein
MFLCRAPDALGRFFFVDTKKRVPVRLLAVVNCVNKDSISRPEREEKKNTPARTRLMRARERLQGTGVDMVDRLTFF